MKTTEEKHIYTVSELTKNIRFVLEEAFGNIWVDGEVSNFVKHSSGHMYFSIKDENSVLSCVFFRHANSKLNFEIKNGMRILCYGKISVYDKRGQYQFYPQRVEPKGVGALQIAFEQLKEKLFKEGLFDESHKREIPYLPQRVGVITSPTGAAIRDILNVAERRFSNIEIILNPVAVQGDFAKNEISAAIDSFNTFRNIDVIILGRGGGSLEDLWPFNEEVVARAVYNSKIPIISAVGHEIDWTISDFVADFRAPTPSAAAELIIPKKEDLIERIKGLSERMNVALTSQLDFLSERLSAIKDRYVFREPLNIITQYEQRIDSLAEDLALKGGFMLKAKKETLSALAGKLGALSPLGVLSRGYSITRRGDQIIKDVKDLKKKELINTRVERGEIISRIEEVKQ
ncbi:MAG: exodeoxyribonuclease VII large subunit [Candidatus Omnitrophota bacterium]